MSYEVYIDVRHHPKHGDEDEQRESAAFRLADPAGDPILTVADCLRGFADEMDPARADLSALTKQNESLRLLAERQQEALEALADAADWYRRSLEGVVDNVPVRDLDEARVRYDSAYDGGARAVLAEEKPA